MAKKTKDEKKPVLERSLEAIARFQKRYSRQLFILIILITLFLGFGLSNIRLQTDIFKEMPQDLDIMILNDRIKDIFGGQDTVVVLIELDDTLDTKNMVDDIRNPYIIQSIIALDDVLSQESGIESVTSVASFFRGRPFYTTEHVRAIIESQPQSQAFFSSDYRSTLMYIRADVGGGEEKIIQLSKLVQDDIDSVPGIPGVKISLTGNPPIRVVMFDMLKHDAIFTLLISAFIILILLYVMERAFTKALLVFVPLLIGLIWTMGTLGWLDMPLSIATAGLGAMILGLGVEYGVFMYSRYYEERQKGKSQLDSLTVAVPGVGSAIFGSGLTTIVGFLALTLSVMPMLQHLGQSLALGIFFCLIAAIFVAPVVYLIEEDLEYWYTHYMHAKLTEKKDRHMRTPR